MPFPGIIFQYIFLNENVWASIKISLMFVPKGPINNIPVLVQIMAWRLSEPMMLSLLMYVCITRPQWVKGTSFNQSLFIIISMKTLKTYRYKQQNKIWVFFLQILFPFDSQFPSIMVTTVPTRNDYDPSNPDNHINNIGSYRIL